MKKQILKMALGMIVASALFTSCKKDKVVTPEPNAEEVITTIIVQLTPVGGGAVLKFQSEDLDGPGANPFVAQEIVLAPNKVYNAEIFLLDKTKTPADSTSNEVREEGKDHQFYYSTTSGTNLVVSNLDKDVNNNPLGLESTWTTGAASTGKIRIVLKHKPGAKGANDAITVGETDIDTQEAFNGFNVKIQ
jgi:hypothetical protein